MRRALVGMALPDAWFVSNSGSSYRCTLATRARCGGSGAQDSVGGGAAASSRPPPCSRRGTPKTDGTDPAGSSNSERPAPPGEDEPEGYRSSSSISRSAAASVDWRRAERGFRFDDPVMLCFCRLAAAGVRLGTERLRRTARAGVAACRSSSGSSDFRPRRRLGEVRSGASDKRRFLFGPYSSSSMMDLTSSSDSSGGTASGGAASSSFFGLCLPATDV